MKVFNTLSGQKEKFLPQGDEVKMYVCGVTPYDDCHIGHAMSYVAFDVIRRYLQFRGYKVKYVQNITDIDDKIIDRANKLGISTSELAEKFTNSYFDNMDALNIGRADIYPRATKEIPKIIEVIQGLIAKGHAYPAQGSVYFRVRSVPDYGKLSHRSLESMMAGEGTVGEEEKEHPMDFALWKASKPDEPSWGSPWGEGRPGWHIECSAMSLKYLGNTLDIHGGGQDLVFPHHENEIAQSESFTGIKPFVKYWLHNGLLQLGADKMSKSLGNLITIKEALAKYSADAIRIFILSSHYRSPLTYSEVALQATEVALRVFTQAKWKLTDPYGEMNRSMLEAQGIKTDNIAPVKDYYNRFTLAMDDDFNTAQALATLFDLAQEINRAVNLGHEDKVAEHREIFNELAEVLSLTLPEPEIEEETLEAEIYRKSQTLEEHALKNFEEAIKPVEAGLPQLDKNEVILVSLIKDLRNEFVHGTYPSLDEAASSTQIYRDNLKSLHDQIAHRNFKGVIYSLSALSSSATANIGSLSSLREQLRKEKKWRQADMIRAKLSEAGTTLEDTPKGTVWKRRR